MRKITILSLVMLMTLSGCAPSAGEEVFTEEPATRYGWAAPAGADKADGSAVDIRGGGMTTDITHFLFNDELLTLDRSIQYDGSPLHFDFRLTYEAKFPCNVTLRVSVNGIEQPFYIEGVAEERTKYTASIEGMSLFRPAVIIEEPVLLTDEPVWICFEVTGHYDYTYTKSTASPASTFSHQFGCYLSPAPGYGERRTLDRGAVAPLDVMDHQWAPCAIDQPLFFDVVNGFQVTAEPQSKAEFYLPLGPDDTLYTALCEPAGEYRTVVHVDGELAALWDGKTYLDWHSDGESQQVAIPLDTASLPAGSHNLYVTTYSLDAIQNQTIHSQMTTAEYHAYTVIKPS